MRIKYLIHFLLDQYFAKEKLLNMISVNPVCTLIEEAHDLSNPPLAEMHCTQN